MRRFTLQHKNPSINGDDSYVHVPPIIAVRPTERAVALEWKTIHLSQKEVDRFDVNQKRFIPEPSSVEPIYDMVTESAKATAEHDAVRETLRSLVEKLFDLTYLKINLEHTPTAILVDTVVEALCDDSEMRANLASYGVDEDKLKFFLVKASKSLSSIVRERDAFSSFFGNLSFIWYTQKHYFYKPEIDKRVIKSNAPLPAESGAAPQVFDQRLTAEEKQKAKASLTIEEEKAVKEKLIAALKPVMQRTNERYPSLRK